MLLLARGTVVGFYDQHFCNSHQYWCRVLAVVRKTEGCHNLALDGYRGNLINLLARGWHMLLSPPRRARHKLQRVSPPRVLSSPVVGPKYRRCGESLQYKSSRSQFVQAAPPALQPSSPVASPFDLRELLVVAWPPTIIKGLFHHADMSAARLFSTPLAGGVVCLATSERLHARGEGRLSGAPNGTTARTLSHRRASSSGRSSRVSEFSRRMEKVWGSSGHGRRSCRIVLAAYGRGGQGGLSTYAQPVHRSAARALPSWFEFCLRDVVTNLGTAPFVQAVYEGRSGRRTQFARRAFTEEMTRDVKVRPLFPRPFSPDSTRRHLSEILKHQIRLNQRLYFVLRKLRSIASFRLIRHSNFFFNFAK